MHGHPDEVESRLSPSVILRVQRSCINIARRGEPGDEARVGNQKSEIDNNKATREGNKIEGKRKNPKWNGMFISQSFSKKNQLFGSCGKNHNPCGMFNYSKFYL